MMWLFEDWVRSTRKAAWRLLETQNGWSVRTGLSLTLGHRRFSRLFLGAELDLVRTEVLRMFLAEGAPFSTAHLAASLDRPELEVRHLLAELARLDRLTLSQAHDRILSAYPFSQAVTRHRVHLPGGGEHHALCAVDALGIPLLAGGVGEIRSSCANSGRSIQIVIRQRRISEQEPKDCVLGIGRAKQGGHLAKSTCPHVNFFADPVEAKMWLDQKDDLMSKNVFSLTAAMVAARRLFDERLSA
jgi:hypothetical protein